MFARNPVNPARVIFRKGSSLTDRNHIAMAWSANFSYGLSQTIDPNQFPAKVIIPASKNNASTS
jgi:hypothetical protein